MCGYGSHVIQQSIVLCNHGRTVLVRKLHCKFELIFLVIGHHVSYMLISVQDVYVVHCNLITIAFFRIIFCSGDLKITLTKHKGPIFSLKWNKKGDYLLTGSCDKTAIVWDVKAEEPKQQFEFHSGIFY